MTCMKSRSIFQLITMACCLSGGVICLGGGHGPRGHVGCDGAPCGAHGCGMAACQQEAACQSCGQGCRQSRSCFGHGHGCRGCGPSCCGRCGHGSLHDCLAHDATEKRYFLRSQGKSWHSGWYDPAVGRPMALMVPPTAEFTSEYSWGVPSSRVMPIYHQFRRPYPGAGVVSGGTSFMPTPGQPSDSVQFGVHPVRGPWGAY
jgi:hypothetical protein